MSNENIKLNFFKRHKENLETIFPPDTIEFISRLFNAIEWIAKIMNYSAALLMRFIF